jgi:DNA-binding Lrp family transcriptional regulator
MLMKIASYKYRPTISQNITPYGGANLKKEEVEIIKRLIENPRESYAKIAKELGFSAESVRQKVLKMLEDGTLKLYCVPEGKHFGKRRITLILSIPMQSKIEVIEKLKAIPQTIEIRSGVLSSTVVMDIVTKDVDKDTHKLMRLFENLGVEVKEVFESEWVHFDSKKMID